MLENDHINPTYQKLWDVTKVTLGKFIYVYLYMFVYVHVYTHYKNRNHDISIQFKSYKKRNTLRE